MMNRYLVITTLLAISGIELSCCKLVDSSKQELRTETIWFHPITDGNEDSSIALKGKVYFPPAFGVSETWPCIIMFHGLRNDMSHLDDLARSMALEGIVCLAVDFRGHGDSGGSFKFDDPLSYDVIFADGEGALRWLKRQHYIDHNRIAAFGFSLGGGAAAYLGVTGGRIAFIAWYPCWTYEVAGKPLYMQVSRMISVDGLIIHGTNDRNVRCDPAFTRYFASLNPSVTVIWVQGGEHGTDGEYSFYKTKSIEWIRKLWDLSTSE